jgi:hypothetical protein
MSISSVRYSNLLNRPPDPFGVMAFTTLLVQFTPRGAVAGLILASPEYHQDVIRSMYRQYLRRDADNGGLNAFTQLMETEEMVIAAILGSQEYFTLVV